MSTTPKARTATHWKRVGAWALGAMLLAGCFYLWRTYRDLTAVPSTRLQAGRSYPEMPRDAHHIYLQIPIDHTDPGRGTFTDFYMLDPAFRPGHDVIFWLFDNQQERVGLMNRPQDFDYFKESLGSLSFVLIGNRGVAPTLFPEVYRPGGKPDYATALKLYGSQQQVEDIETVRRDMQEKGLLPHDGKIMLYGGSGGGFLVQQYLARYGSHVSRALIESSGAPDIARARHSTFARSLYDSNPEVARRYFSMAQRGDTTSLAFMLFKLGLKNDHALQERLVEEDGIFNAIGGRLLYLKKWFNPSTNFPLVQWLLALPSEVEVKVRIYELLAPDLVSYHPSSPEQTVLMYEWTRVVLADMLAAEAKGKIAVPAFQLDRSAYTGEVLVWTGTGDQDFSRQMGEWLRESYPNARLAEFGDAHERNLYPAYYRSFREAFFSTGLRSPETQKYFDDPKQLIH